METKMKEEDKTPYENLLGEKIIEVLSKNRITKRFKVELEEQITYSGKSAQYQHHLASTVYAINREELSKQPLSSKLEDYWYNEDQEPLAQRFLEGTIAYLKDNYQETLFKINNTTILDPSIPEEENGKYVSEFLIFSFSHQSSILARY